ncbi:LPS export ABC transporter periplasmic protein LptC [uncultured Parasphingopyxis sp.]|uniref:LPS export ABC transporter periplasmic protein LptC n=2 Tax=Parasphingopyxis TaxID=1234545 RepID=UPI00260FC8A6|nr:LPS export ABC transporter periplasmic protein LptC [uncultured Parasphingopyxis sp.]
MSEAARQQRNRRQAWAHPGGRHDKLVGLLNILLPCAVGVLAAFLAMAPLQQNSELNFLLSKDNVEIADERLRVEAARYSGADDRGRLFELRAQSAVQRSSDTPVVEMENLTARIDLDDGPAVIVARDGRYDMDEQTVAVEGPVLMRASDGYRLETSDVDVDLGAREMRSTGAVTGRIPLGRFQANGMRVNIEDRSVVLNGRARLRIEQGGVR